MARVAEGDVTGNVGMEKCTVVCCLAVPPHSSLSHSPTGAAVPELQLSGQFRGNPILLATTEQLAYFDCHSYDK